MESAPAYWEVVEPTPVWAYQLHQPIQARAEYRIRRLPVEVREQILEHCEDIWERQIRVTRRAKQAFLNRLWLWTYRGINLSVHPAFKGKVKPTPKVLRTLQQRWDNTVYVCSIA